MLDTADVMIHRHPAPRRLGQPVLMARAVAQEVPAALPEGVEGVGLALRRRPTALGLDVLPGGMVGEGEPSS